MRHDVKHQQVAGVSVPRVHVRIKRHAREYTRGQLKSAVLRALHSLTDSTQLLLHSVPQSDTKLTVGHFVHLLNTESECQKRRVF